MAKYSRVSKYEDLRNRLQNDSDTKIESKDLSRFEKKLNEINANNFEAPQNTYEDEGYDPIHARRKQYMDNTNEIVTPRINEEPKTETVKPIQHESNSLYNNDYLNDYIREVKKYNMEQGNAYSTNTDLNVLHSIKKDEPPVVPNKPYVEEKKYDSNPFYSFRDEDSASIPTMNTNKQQKQDSSYTSEIPTFKSSKRTFEEFMDDDNDELDTSTMTKEDIAAEVQSLIREQGFDSKPNNNSYSNSSGNKKVVKKNHSDTLDFHLEAERNARQQLLNETTQMRAQLDNYEDNLSEVSSKMQHTDRMVSNVLIVLIIVLIVVLLVVIYWILNANGIL